MKTGDQIEQKRLNFLSKLFALCGDDTSKGCDMYDMGRRYGYDTAEIKQVVEELSGLDLIKVEKGSDKICITPKGIDVIKRKIEDSAPPEST